MFKAMGRDDFPLGECVDGKNVESGMEAKDVTTFISGVGRRGGSLSQETECELPGR